MDRYAQFLVMSMVKTDHRNGKEQSFAVVVVAVGKWAVYFCPLIHSYLGPPFANGLAVYFGVVPPAVVEASCW